MIGQPMMNMEQLSGSEFYLPIGTTTTLDDFLARGEEVGAVFQYLQNEFPEYWPNQCTLYWPMTALSCVIGRQLTRDERYELATLGTHRDDWYYNRGANVSTGVDVVRSWWNRNNPNDQIVSFLVVNSTPIRRKILDKRFIYVSGFYGNQKYNEDANDGKLEWFKFWYPTYWHCTAELLSTVLDNYWNKYDRLNYLACVRSKVIHNTGFVMFKTNGLSENINKQLSAMKKGIWNGSEAGRIATRSEAIIMITRWLGITDELLWNKERPDQKISKSELAIVCERAGITPPKDTKRWSIAEIFG